MRRLVLQSGIVLFSMIFIFTACKKDENDDSSTSTKTVKEYLTAGYWKVTGMTIDPGLNFGGTVITDFYSQMPDCQKDDLTKFNSDGSITDDEGATKCNPNDPQTTNDGSWVLSSDNASVTISYPNEDPMTVTIITLNDNTLKGTYTMVEDLGGGPLTYTFTITMTRQ